MNHHGSASPGEKLISGEALTRYGAQRVCQVPQCATWLSRYNPDALCSQHRGWGLAIVPQPRARHVVDETQSIDWIDWVLGKTADVR